MRPTSMVRAFAATAIASIVVAIGGSSAFADNIDLDSDTLTAGDQTTAIAFGAVPCGVAASRSVDLWVNRNGNNTNTYANGSSVAVTAGSPVSAVTASILSGITMPAGWVDSANNVDSPRVRATVTVRSSVEGSGSATVTFTGTGRNVNGAELVRTVGLPVTYTVASCSTPTTTTITCATGPFTFTGLPQTPCNAATTGENGFTAVPDLTWTDNTDAGTATVTASFAGTANHLASSATRTFVIERAPSTTTITCNGVTYTGEDLAPCTAEATGPGGLRVDLTGALDYDNNRDAGTASATATYGGDANHLTSSGSQNFSIGQASASCTVTPYSGVYDGEAHGLTGTCSLGQTDLSAGLTFGRTHTDAGSHSVDWSFKGGANVADQAGTSTVTIARAPSSVRVSCLEEVVFTGNAQEVCTAVATGAALSQPVPTLYVGNIHAGTATASASFDGGANHEPASDSATFEITKATSTTTLTCLAGPHVYTAEPQTPCTATVTGAGDLDLDVPVHYQDNEDAGSAGASASWFGDADHTGSSDSTTFTIVPAPSQVTVLCAGPFTYSGSPVDACSASASRVGADPVALGVAYDDNVNAGNVTATASWAGDRNHTGASGSGSFTIERAVTTVSLTCPSAVVYDGTRQEPCSARASAPASGLSQALTPTYLHNIGAGTATASATYAGDRNHTPDSATARFEIRRAVSLTAVTCTGPVVFTGAPQTPCSARATGVGGLDETLEVGYADNTRAGNATASAAYPGGADHESSADSVTFVIEKAPSTVTVDCDTPVVYDGSPKTPCTAHVTGPGGLDEEVTVVYAANRDAGIATATATFPGDADHTGDEVSMRFVIEQAPSSIVIVCGGSRTFTGAPVEPCTATATGAGMDPVTVPVGYTDNVIAGTATASASWAGDDNHTGSTGSRTFVVEQAPSSIVIVCGGSRTFTGAPVEPCTATATGAGMDPITVPVGYTDNVIAGTATASASWAGDDNHTGGTGSRTFVVEQATSSVTVTCPIGPFYFTGNPVSPACTAHATGAGGLSVDVTASVTFSANTEVGTAKAGAAYPGDANHIGATGSTTFQILGWTTSGFFQPVDMGTTTTRVWNTVKNGSTVPLKFRLFAGAIQRTSTSDIASFTAAAVSCQTGAEDAVEEFTTTGGTSLRYDTTAAQFVQNWQTPRKPGACYKATMTALDGTSIVAYFKLK